MADFGLFSALYAVSSAVGGLIDFGSSQFKTRQLSQGMGLETFRSWLRRRAFYQCFPVLVLAFAAVLCVHGGLPVASSMLLTFQAFTAPLAAGVLAGVRSLSSAAKATWFIVAGNAFFLAAVTLAPSRWLLVLAGLGASGSWIVTLMLGLRSLRPKLLGAHQSSFVGSPWLGARGFGLFGVAVAVQGLDVVLLAFVAGATEAGRYAAVSRWVQPVLLVAYGFGVHAFPEFSRATSNRAAIRLMRSGWPAVLGALAVAFVIAAIAPWVTPLLLGERYEASARLLQFLALAVIPVTLCQPLVALVQARHRENWAAIAVATATGVIVIVILVGARSLGAFAIPAAWGIGFSSLLIALVIEVRRLLDGGEATT